MSSRRYGKLIWRRNQINFPVFNNANNAEYKRGCWLLPPKQYKEQEAQTDNRVHFLIPEKQSFRKAGLYLVPLVWESLPRYVPEGVQREESRGPKACFPQALLHFSCLNGKCFSFVFHIYLEWPDNPHTRLPFGALAENHGQDWMMPAKEGEW